MNDPDDWIRDEIDPEFVTASKEMQKPILMGDVTVGFEKLMNENGIDTMLILTVTLNKPMAATPVILARDNGLPSYLSTISIPIDGIPRLIEALERGYDMTMREG